MAKTDVRLAAYADVDECNAAIGVVLAAGWPGANPPEDITRTLRRVQNDLFDVGADLCTPITPDPKYPPLRVTEDYVERLEQDCDEFNARLPKLDSFILPGGTRRRPSCTWPGPWRGGPSAPPGRSWKPTPSTPTRSPRST